MEDLSTISQVIIYPAIGIARVGNSQTEFFYGPEIPGMPVTDKGDFRDGTGAIKRQAARFRLYGADAQGKIIRELTAADGDIQWTVHVANKKTAWYDFDLAFDIPAAKGEIKGYNAVVSSLRNATIEDRKRLVIDGGPLSISGTNTNAAGKDEAFAFNKGTIYQPSGEDKPVYLGELRTDDAGRLIFLGGMGESGSFMDEPATTFANNETWYDDTSDGSVDAVIRIKNGATELTFQAEGAWVVTCPPDYAPGVRAFVTGHDLLLQTAEDSGYNVLPEMPSFWRHIYPILEKLPVNQWVNEGIFVQHGWGSGADWSQPERIAQLADPGEGSLALRSSIFNQFRNPDYKVIEAEYLPPVYGDGVQSFASTDTDPRNFMALLPFQYQYLKLWSKGQFRVDQPIKPTDWENLPPAAQASGLTKAALEETIGGPFHPGCEFTWPMRHGMMYSKPFRIKRRPDAPLDYGRYLDSEMALAPGGPLDGSSPGDITRWMAVPWQTDTSSCLSGYIGMMGLYVPTFWPVRVPNDVLTEESYHALSQSGLSAVEKMAAFTKREKWLRGIVYKTSYPPATYKPYTKGINEFITKWPLVGIVVQKEGPADEEGILPETMWVETGRQIPVAVKTRSLEALAPEEEDDTYGMDEGYLWMMERSGNRRRGR